MLALVHEHWGVQENGLDWVRDEIPGKTLLHDFPGQCTAELGGAVERSSELAAAAYGFYLGHGLIPVGVR
ncbi:ATP/GTP-binding protein [Caulifigura coniformis]|uniref:ATP/GTP-binding protein n=1 Tax=Caulifigura coniformis TaxID=2527983 RepID=UPI0011A89369|nr:ATP/GTP-binding protein [Caulifigura coniformis]